MKVKFKRSTFDWKRFKNKFLGSNSTTVAREVKSIGWNKEKYRCTLIY